MATRKEYIDKLEAKLREWNTQLDEYQAKAEGRSNKLQANFNEKAEEIRAKRSEIRQKLDEIKGSGEDTFSRLKVDADQLWDNIKAGFADIQEIIKR